MTSRSRPAPSSTPSPGVMALAFVVALVFMPAGKVTESPAEDEVDQTPAGAA